MLCPHAMDDINRKMAIRKPEHLDCILLFLLNKLLKNRGETRFCPARRVC
jgi:hypothetical protein